MRIIGGEFKSRQIKFPRGAAVRPTKDRAREAIFNMIAGRIQGASVLDLYAGSGAFGIEALSRGAKEAVFVDTAAQSVKTIKRNLVSLGIPRARTLILKMNADKAIKKMAKQKKRFSILFIDPPYYRGIANQCLISIIRYGIVTHCGFIVVEHHKTDALPEKEGSWALMRSRAYGDVIMSIYEYMRECSS